MNFFKSSLLTSPRAFSFGDVFFMVQNIAPTPALGCWKDVQAGGPPMPMPRAPPAGTSENATCLQLLDFLAKRFFRFAKSCLQTAQKLLILSLSE